MKLITLTSLMLVATVEITGVFATGTQTIKSKVSRANPGKQSPSTFPRAGQATSQGCFSSSANMTAFSVPNMSSGSCTRYCITKNFWVAGLNGGSCLCGFVYPPKKDMVSDTKCNTPCPFYPQEACGTYPSDGETDAFYSVFNTGINILAKNYSPPKPSTTSSSSSSTKHHSTSETTSSATSSATDATATVTAPAETTTVPSKPDGAGNDDNNDEKKKKSNPNVAAIVAGVVVGVVVVGAAIGGGFFFLRRKRNAEIEEEHRRNAAVNAFISGSKPPSSHGSISMTDSRMDPVLAHRRLSDGSIADNQDYSRKILRVTNA